MILNRDASKDHEDFNRNYTEYEQGFGDSNGEFWLGLQTMHQLTVNCSELTIEMEKYDGSIYVAHYDSFRVGSKEEGYVLNVTDFSSNPVFGDSLKFDSGNKFSTIDHDEVPWGINCAYKFNGGWCMVLYLFLSKTYRKAF